MIVKTFRMPRRNVKGGAKREENVQNAPQGSEKRGRKRRKCSECPAENYWVKYMFRDVFGLPIFYISMVY